MENIIIMCGASRGKYGKAQTLSEVYKKKLPETGYCDKCKKRYKIENLRVFRWKLIPQEIEEAVRDFDIFSLDMPDKILCLKCIKKEDKEGKDG